MLTYQTSESVIMGALWPSLSLPSREQSRLAGRFEGVFRAAALGPLKKVPGRRATSQVQPRLLGSKPISALAFQRLS